jgi:hypothetical protein
VIGRVHHLQEERLFDCYLAERGGESIDPRVAEHLSDCAGCAARYADLVGFMDGLRADGDAETDRIFTPDRLRAQQQRILERIALVGRPARILDFPGRLVARTLNPSHGHGVSRWVYGAAAAGLAIGVGIGAFFESDWMALQTSRTPRAVMTAARSAATVGTRAPVEAADEAFLVDLDAALEQPHTPSLQPFDALTPHVREVSDRVR